MLALSPLEQPINDIKIRIEKCLNKFWIIFRFRPNSTCNY
jgi:hypothetical protein